MLAAAIKLRLSCWAYHAISTYIELTKKLVRAFILMGFSFKSVKMKFK